MNPQVNCAGSHRSGRVRSESQVSTCKARPEQDQRKRPRVASGKVQIQYSEILTCTLTLLHTLLHVCIGKAPATQLLNSDRCVGV